jgi:DNA-binding transcriptional LysR family regulator
MTRGIDWETRIGRRVRLRDLHILSAVVQAGSMIKGASQLGVSQPVVSQAIADLEAAVGVRLLDRSSRGVEPTSYGRALLKHSQMAFDDLRQGIREIESIADPAGGEVWIGCPESLCGPLLTPAIKRLLRVRPRMNFHVAHVYTLSAELEFPELRDRSVDLVLARLVKPFGEFEFEEDLRVEHLFDEDLVVVAGSANPWTRRRKINLVELAGASWVLPPNSWNMLRVKEAFAAIGHGMPRTTVETFSVALRNQLLASGGFVAAVPGSMLYMNAEHRLKVLPISLPARPWPVVMVTLKNRTLAPPVEHFAQCVRGVVTSRHWPLTTLESSRDKRTGAAADA